MIGPYIGAQFLLHTTDVPALLLPPSDMTQLTTYLDTEAQLVKTPI
ncbi:MAG: hypothetical protein R2822_05675 [Spirosomataceae bacterium]